MQTTLTTNDLPASMTLPGVEARPTTPKPVLVLTCEHGVACPPCVLAAARRVFNADASLVGPYTD